LWDPRDSGLAGLTYILAPFLGPTIGPLVGAYIVDQYDNNWKFSIWVILFIAAPVAVAILLMKETSKARIQYLKAKKRGENIVTEKPEVSVASAIGKAMLRPLHMCLLEVCPVVHFSPI
jgi:MFS family permease